MTDLLPADGSLDVGGARALALHSMRLATTLPARLGATAALLSLLLRPAPGGAARLDGAAPLTVRIVVVTLRDGEVVRGLGGDFDRVEGEPLDVVLAADPSRYRLTCDDQPASAVAVSRKSRPADMAKTGGWEFVPVLTHELFLHLSTPLAWGATCRVALDGLVQGEATATFTLGEAASPALKVNQIGYLPGTPKHAYLTHWLGDGGPLEPGPDLDGFSVVDLDTGLEALRGEPVLRHRADQLDETAYDQNLESADVWSLDFEGLVAPGRYRLEVAGVGASLPFVVGERVYEEAFSTAMHGLFMERCGMRLGPPHTAFERPLCHHPDMGKVAERSGATLLDTSMGMMGGGESSFEALVRLRTGEPFPAWGGYHDAGDWDRRAQHMWISDELAFAYELFPERHRDGQLGLPESGDGLPDILTESLWNMRFWARLQEDDGAVHGGLESEEHPAWGDSSWTDGLDLFAYAPDPWVSYVFAASACKTSRALRLAGDAVAADELLERAERAFAWAEA